MTKAPGDNWEKLKFTIDQIRIEYQKNAHIHPSETMSTLLILGEDHRFRYHCGVDPIALCRATWRTYGCGHREGASTIAMQLVRTLTGQYEKTLARKFDEIQLAVRLTKHVRREELPTLYLWVAYYGWRMNNFHQACNRLGINPKASSLQEAAQLVARLKYPEPQIQSPNRALLIAQRCIYLVHRYRITEPYLKYRMATRNGTFQSPGTVAKST